ncbi:MAG: hypothetical protein EAX95_04455 [Candidatus Thorarchaeota archaeon]|nr:hypothetical protein [Candidatus Thorarchaeota archaeon]
MTGSNRRLLGFVLVLITILCASAAVLIYTNAPADSLEIDFVPNSISTSPGEIGWFLVEIDSTRPLDNHEVAIHTNVSIPANFTYWPDTPLLEVFLYPNSSHIDLCIEVEVTLSSDGFMAQDIAFLSVLNWTFEELAQVIEKRDVFVDYLATHYPTFGINETTDWTPIHNGAGILIVGHYLFKSSHWEMELAWHVMIAPHDWVQVYLRQRVDLQPSWAGQIDSWSTDNDTVVEMDPPEEIYRSMWSG